MRAAPYIKAALTVTALVFLASYVDPSSMLKAARGADGIWIAAALLLMPLNVALEGLVWHLMVRRVESTSTLADHVGALFAGYALGFFTPGRAGEFAGRAFYIRHDDRWEIAAVVGAQALFEMGVLYLAGALAAIVYLDVVNPQPVLLWRCLALTGCLLGAIFTGIALNPHRVEGLLPFRRLAFIRRRLGFLQRLSRRDAAGILGLNVLRYLVYSTQFFLLLRALVPGAAPSAAYVGIALVFFAKILLPPITLMDLGVREGASVFFLGSLGFPEAAALNASLLLFGINLLLPAAAGVPLIMRLRLSQRTS